ncbi:hypothetical protein [Chromobacterium violaceum]|uniref:Uncharacterized protein n=1 Tax=Chromobacterium violaceum TaxID=536 RepID=A0A202B2I2_CHRVL|nr:hypothetical protein [Chromobacterium violaceum]OVE45677.1 hypothetical protein CBW21_22045 [Chromobacterium violaceum]
MELFHTSPNEITAISKNGRFGEFLCFSGNVYTMTAGQFVTYKLEINEELLIEAGSLFYHEDAAKLDVLVAQFCRRFDVDEDTAEEIISEREQLDSADADDLWDVQLFTARAAKLLGYRGCIMSDEQGALYMIDMLGHEAELVRAD